MNLSDYKLPKAKKQKGIHSYAHEVAKQVCLHFNEMHRFGTWIGIAYRIGAGELKAKFDYVKEKGKGANYLMSCCRSK